ncbi:M1 family metallopeptidase [Nonomuraea zeae]|uniref:M1 family metallopeptidase n=1 Tax=Nonomuraea zeae TaxID=1642303 RepID=A0A5S4FBG1_9ACTN|nr:M1 family metallopeptidase [Nonomuraea zeae]TMR14887.1 M1 family metallopeptidase [Nonomuraea zeae]
MAMTPYFPGHGDHRYGVSHYDLTLKYRVAGNRLDGTARLTVAAAEPLHVLDLDLGRFRVLGVTVDGVPARHLHGQGKLRVTLPRPLPAGAAAGVEVRYTGSPLPVPSPWGGLPV